LVLKILGAVFLAIAVYVFYLWFTYIDETVYSGTAYGLTIGDSKQDTYRKIPSSLSQLSNSGDIYILIKVENDNQIDLATNSGHTIMVKTLLHDIGFQRFKDLDTWEFYIDASLFNSLKLKFCKNSLCEIHRHRKYFDLP